MPLRPSSPLLLSLLLLALLIACSQGGELPQTESTAVVDATATPTVELTPQASLPTVENSFTLTSAAPEVSTQISAATPTVTLTPTPFVFAVIGDFGYDSAEADSVSQLVLSWKPEIIITTGDNNYPSGAEETIDDNIGQYFHSYIAPYEGKYGPGGDINRFFPVPGNHDWETPGLEPYLEYFTLPGNERYYDFTWGPVHFFALDSDSREPDGVNASSIQAQWFQQRLADSSTPWQIAYMHHAPYSSSYHGSTDWAKWPYASWGVDGVLAGHDHVYERLTVEGIPYFTVGLSGSPNRYWFSNILPESVVRYREEHGAMRVTATATTLSFEFFTIEGELIDSLTLTHPSVGHPPPAETPASAQTEPAPNVVTFPDPAAYVWQPVGTGYNSPILLTHAGDGSNRLFVVEQPGAIQIMGQTTPFLDIRDRVGDEGNEQGLLGLAFHPDYEENGYFYVNYTDTNGDTVIARYSVSTDDPTRADPATALTLLHVRQPYPNHNGGHLAFGPDGYLYIALGDGGSAGDPEDNAQNSFTLLGKLLRIDINTEPYEIPAENPFTNGDGLGEIWAYGLRNPWRFTFDRVTGDLYIGDVGQGEWEEIDFLPAGTPGGVNFGWDYFEGTHPFEGNPPDGLPLTSPVWEYSHATGTCSVTGGVVYRGPTLPPWNGVYLYGDYCSGQIWGLLRDASGLWQNTLLYETGVSITSLGEDEAGEVYLVARQGEIYQLISR